jgi:ferric-dicitrate binding protein FerR (iron transport regulator)
MKQSERMAVLLFLHARMEISDREEMELTNWRKKSPENEKLFQEISNPEQVRQMMTEYYRERDRGLEKLKAHFPFLAGANLYRANEDEEVERMMEFPEKDIAESGLSKAEFWTALLTDREFLVDKKRSDLKIVAKLVDKKPAKPKGARNILRIFLKAAAIIVIGIVTLFVGGVVYLHLPHSASDRFQAVMILPDGSSSASDEYHEGWLDGHAGITFDKNEKGEPVLVFPDHSKKSKEDSFTLKTLTGNEKILRLPDKTMLWMSAVTTVNLPALFSQDSIQIKLYGEAWIETALLSKRHIIVSTINDQRSTVNGKQSSVIELEVLSPGTKFNFSAYPDDDTIRATLIEGTANVQFTGDSGKRSIPLQAGQQFRFSNGKYSVKPIVNNLEAMAIKNGEIVIPGTDIPTILAKLKRWYDFEIIYQDGGVPAGRYSLQIPIGTNLIEVGHRLQRQGALVYTIGNKIVVFSH